MILYDASAFFVHLEKKSIDYTAFILDLTYYEVGNILWKHICKLKTITLGESKEPLQIIQNWQNTISLEKSELPAILELAAELGLSFYDAAYVFYAKKHGFTLHTCDKSLYEKANKAVKMEFVRC